MELKTANIILIGRHYMKKIHKRIEPCMHEMHLSTKRHKMLLSILISGDAKQLFKV